MNAKKHPLKIHIDQRIIEESKEIAGQTHIPIEMGVSLLPNLIRFPYTNEDPEKLENAFIANGKDGKPFIRNKKSMLFIVGGGAIMGSFNNIFANNQLEAIVGIDISAAQLYNFKYLMESAALEESRGKKAFLRRSSRSSCSSTTLVNKIEVLCRRQEINENIFGYPLVIEAETKDRSYFPVPARGLYNGRKRVELIRDDIINYLKNVEAPKAPDLIYTSNLSEWNSGLTFKAILETIKTDSKFQIGTVVVDTHLSEVFVYTKVIRVDKPTIIRYN